MRDHTTYPWTFLTYLYRPRTFVWGSEFALESRIHLWCILCNRFGKTLSLDAPKKNVRFGGKFGNPQVKGWGLSTYLQCLLYMVMWIFEDELKYPMLATLNDLTIIEQHPTWMVCWVRSMVSSSAISSNLNAAIMMLENKTNVGTNECLQLLARKQRHNGSVLATMTANLWSRRSLQIFSSDCFLSLVVG